MSCSGPSSPESWKRWGPQRPRSRTKCVAVAGDARVPALRSPFWLPRPGLARRRNRARWRGSVHPPQRQAGPRRTGRADSRRGGRDHRPDSEQQLQEAGAGAPAGAGTQVQLGVQGPHHPPWTLSGAPNSAEDVTVRLESPAGMGGWRENPRPSPQQPEAGRLPGGFCQGGGEVPYTHRSGALCPYTSSHASQSLLPPPLGHAAPLNASAHPARAAPPG